VPLGQQHRLQRLGIIRKVIAHRQIRAYSRPPDDEFDAPDSLRRSAAHNYPALRYRRCHELPSAILGKSLCLQDRLCVLFRANI
jgi:hypothetical protein